MRKTLTTIFLTACALCASATDYYVSVEGGELGKDGSDWDHAWSITELQTNFNSDNSKLVADGGLFNNGDNVYFAAGKYVPTATLFVKVGINLIGAEGASRTIFSGDIDCDNEVTPSDRDRLFQLNTAIAHGNTEKCISITNIDFSEVYTDISDYNTKERGAIYLDNCGALVTISKCNFSNILADNVGGWAIFSYRSNLKVVDCKFTDIKAANRGVAVRLQSNVAGKGYTTFERCLFANNAATGGTSDACGMVMMQHGQELNFYYCTFVNNKANGNASCIYNKSNPDVNYQRKLTVENCLFYNNESGDNKSIVDNDVSTLAEKVNVIHDIKDNPSAAIKISSVGVGTYYLSLPFTMPAGVTGKTFSSITGSRLTEGTTYKAGDVVPAGTALLVEGAEGTYHPIVAEDDNSAPTNMLSGSDLGATTTGKGKHYKLANGESGLAFYYGATDGAAFTNAAHKAWLVVPEAKARFFFSFSDDDVTGVECITKQTTTQDGKFMENGRMVILKNGVKYNAVGQKL